MEDDTKSRLKRPKGVTILAILFIINGVGVLSRYGTVIGILSKTDVVKCICFMN